MECPLCFVQTEADLRPLRKVAVDLLSGVLALDSLEELSGDEILDTLLDQRQIGHEVLLEHIDNLSDENVVLELLSGPV